METINPVGRYIYPTEYRWLMSYFKDRYDPRRLCIGLMVETGLRTENAVTMKITDFKEEFTEVNVPECKPHVKEKEDYIDIQVKWRWTPLTPGLSTDIKNFIKTRLLLGQYIGEEINNKRLFPLLTKDNLRQTIHKLRKRFGDKQPWLRDIWKTYSYFNEDRVLIKTRNWYRISPHGFKAFNCTAAYDICDKDLVETKELTNHSDVKNLVKYTKAKGVIERKKRLRDEVMVPLHQEVPIPLVKSQKRLDGYV